MLRLEKFAAATLLSSALHPSLLCGADMSQTSVDRGDSHRLTAIPVHAGQAAIHENKNSKEENVDLTLLSKTNFLTQPDHATPAPAQEIGAAVLANTTPGATPKAVSPARPESTHAGNIALLAAVRLTGNKANKSTRMLPPLPERKKNTKQTQEAAVKTESMQHSSGRFTFSSAPASKGGATGSRPASALPRATSSLSSSSSSSSPPPSLQSGAGPFKLSEARSQDDDFDDVILDMPLDGESKGKAPVTEEVKKSSTEPKTRQKDQHAGLADKCKWGTAVVASLATGLVSVLFIDGPLAAEREEADFSNLVPGIGLGLATLLLIGTTFTLGKTHTR